MYFKNYVEPLFSSKSLQLAAFQCILLICLTPRLASCDSDSFEFIVVGGGTAGCVVAARLSKNHTVMLLEAGGHPLPDLDIPAKLVGYFNNREYIKPYQTVAQNNTGLMNNGVFSLMTANTLGGGSSVNCQVYNRGSPYDYNNWANITGDTSWSYAEMLKYLNMIEDYQGEYPSEIHHGTGGPISITQQRYAPGLDTWLEGGMELGYTVSDPNGPQKLGYAPLEFNRKKGLRVSAYQGYLNSAEVSDRSNLKTITEATVEKIIFAGNKAIGVKYTTKVGIVREVRVSKEVVLSAGVINSPAILMRSGIGPRHVLEAANISQVKLLPVGNNLHDHALVHLHFLLKKEKASLFVPDRDLTPRAWKQFEETGDGPYSNFMGITGQAFLVSAVRRQEANPDWADINLHLVQTPSNFDIDGMAELKEKANGRDEIPISTLIMMTRPKSRGRLSLNSSDVNGDPLIDFQYLTHPDDLNAMMDAVKQVLKLFEETRPYQEQGARYLSVPLEFCKHLTFRSDEYWKCFINQMMVPGVHAGGTCRMGKGWDDPEAVVDPKLKVIGIENLRVVDASIMPAVTNANTNAPTFAIGEKGAAEILKLWSEGKQNDGESHEEL